MSPAQQHITYKMKIFRYIFPALFAFLYISCEKDLSVSPEEPAPYSGFLMINSVPSGAAIWMDGKNTGRFTPDSIRWLKEGSYLITLRMNRFRDTSLSVAVSEVKKDSITVDYTANAAMKGRIDLTSVPEKAEVYIDSVFTGLYTPCSIKAVMPGTYRVSLRMKNYWDYDQMVEVYSGKTSTVSRKMVDSTLWVNYNNSNTTLPSNFLTCITEDRFGKRWIGTKDNGIILNVNGGYTVYNTSNSMMPSNYVTAVFSDRSNRKWIGTLEAGLVCIDANSNWYLYTTASGLCSDKITCIAEDKSGRIWVGTGTSGISVFDGSAWNTVSVASSDLPGNIIQSIAVGEDDTKWVGIKYCGLTSIKGGVYTVYNRSNSVLPSNNVRAIAVEKNGTVWIGCAAESPNSGGIVSLNGEIMKQVTVGSTNIVSLSIDISGVKWIVTSDAGLLRLSGAGVTKYNSANSVIPDRLLSSCLIDGSGVKWITTMGCGLVKYKGN